MKINETIGWGIASGRTIMPWSISSTRKDSICNIERLWGRPWKALRKQGCTAVKVHITPMIR